MNLYTLFAISCYIILRGLQTLLEDYKEKRWYKIVILMWTTFMLFAALASLVVFYLNISFLGFEAVE